MTLGEKLSKLRKKNNYTQEQLADLLGISRQSISKWESDTAYPETDKLIELGKLFDCTMDYLLKEDVLDRHAVQPACSAGKIEEIRRMMLTEKNKSRAKKALKTIGVIFTILMTVDILSMIVCFLVIGIPR